VHTPVVGEVGIFVFAAGAIFDADYHPRARCLPLKIRDSSGVPGKPTWFALVWGRRPPEHTLAVCEDGAPNATTKLCAKSARPYARRRALP